MRPYEVMVIFDTGAEPPAIQAVVDQLLETIRGAEGTPGTVDRWGRRAFAYEVKHRREGYYVLVELSGTSRTIEGIDRMLSLADEVLRHKVVRVPDRVAQRAAASNGRGGEPAGAGRARPEPAGRAAGRPATGPKSEEERHA